MTATQQVFVNTRQDAAFRFLGLPTLMRATGETTNGAFGLMEHWDMPVGFASPYHTHRREDESFYVLDGEIAFVCDGKWRKATAGTFVYGPREIPHGFRVIGGRPASMLILCNPGGFEGFMLEQTTPMDEPPAAPDMNRLMTLAAKYGIDLHGPLPEMPADFESEGGMGSGLKDLNYRWIKAFNDRDWNTESALRGAEYRAYLSGVKEPLDSAAWSGFLVGFSQAFPDATIAIDSCVAERDSVVTRWTLSGTHEGPFQGVPPTGRSIRFTGIEFNRVAGDKIVEHWSMFDNVALLQQIGALAG